MGDPKKPKNKYSTPRNPWSSDQLSSELYLLGTYGLRNKRELWKIETELSRIRKQARSLLAAPPDVRERTSGALINRLYNLGLVSEGASIDDILSLKVEDILERRLQSIIWRKGLAKTPYEARQMISHKRIMVGERVVSKPGYLVKRSEEEKLSIRGPVMAQEGAKSGVTHPSKKEKRRPREVEERLRKKRLRKKRLPRLKRLRRLSSRLHRQSRQKRRKRSTDGVSHTYTAALTIHLFT